MWDLDDFAEGAGDLIYVVDETAGGYAVGPALSQLRRSFEIDARGAGWARAKCVLRDLLQEAVGEIVDIGWVKRIGGGLSREVFVADVTLGNGRTDTFVVALPGPDADSELDERTRREVRLLARLRGRALPFHLPDVVGAYPDGGPLALVRRYTAGVPLDLRAGRQARVRPWEVVGEIAAAIHRVLGAEVADLLPGYESRRDHALACLTALDGLELPEMRDALSWARAHVPSGAPSVLVHGDLLGQNILLSPGGPPHVIDWEYAQRGDPAYDLAIVTRGVNKPFQVEHGLSRLLEAYVAAGGAHSVQAEHVHLHELCFLAGWFREEQSRRGDTATPLGRVRSLLRRL